MGNGHIAKKRSQNAPSWVSYCNQSLNPNPEVPARDCEGEELVSGAPRPGSCHGPLACMLTKLSSDQGGWEEDRDVGAGVVVSALSQMGQAWSPQPGKGLGKFFQSPKLSRSVL